MRKLFGLMLGVLSAIGGFVDIGDLVTSALTGARFGMALAWAIVVGAVGIIVFAEMSGRVAAITHRGTFDLVRERLGARMGLANLVASTFVTALTLAAEIGGMALALELASSINYLLWVPVAAFLVWIVIWKVRFKLMENLFGLLGLTLVAFAVAVFRFGPDWGAFLHGIVAPAVPGGEGHPTYFYYAIALLGSSMTPYEVFFFSSGGVEDRWTEADLPEMRANVFLGFPLGAVLSLAIMGAAALILEPAGIEVATLGQSALPVAAMLGKAGLCVVLLGFFATTFGAALETSLGVGYSVAQYLGWAWGKMVRPMEAARFHLVALTAVVLGAGVILTTVDPVQLTEYSVVFSAVALPLTYLPILVVANDPDYMGERTNGRATNLLASCYLVLLVVVSVVTIPLMLATKAGQ